MTEAGAGRTQLSTTCDSGTIMVSEHRVGEWRVGGGVYGLGTKTVLKRYGEGSKEQNDHL